MAKSASRDTPAAINAMFNSADALGGRQIVFDIGGKKYCLVTWINFIQGVVYIRCIGTHRDDDRIDARTA